MQIHVFSIAVVLFAIGGTVVPVPPPPAVVSRVQDVLATSFRSTPEAMHAFADLNDVSRAE